MIYNGKPYEQMDDLGGKRTTIFGNIHASPIKQGEISSSRHGMVYWRKKLLPLPLRAPWVRAPEKKRVKIMEALLIHRREKMKWPIYIPNDDYRDFSIYRNIKYTYIVYIHILYIYIVYIYMGKFDLSEDS